jgi:hypothetical protein
MFGTCLRNILAHTFGTWFVAYLGCFGTCLRHIFGTWFDLAYCGDFEHMIWRCYW